MAARVLLAVVLLVLAIGAPAEAAKKGKKGGGKVNITKAVNVLVPDRPAGVNPSGMLVSTIDVGKRFAGKRIRDVNVTVKTTGSGTPSGGDLQMFLTAPNGATTFLFGGLPSQSIGPLTLDDESLFRFGGVQPCLDPTTLCAPYSGTARPARLLAILDGGRVKGTWTLRVLDRANNDTSLLDFWRLTVKPGDPYETE